MNGGDDRKHSGAGTGAAAAPAPARPAVAVPAPAAAVPATDLLWYVISKQDQYTLTRSAKVVVPPLTEIVAATKPFQYLSRFIKPEDAQTRELVRAAKPINYLLVLASIYGCVADLHKSRPVSALIHKLEDAVRQLGAPYEVRLCVEAVSRDWTYYYNFMIGGQQPVNLTRQMLVPLPAYTDSVRFGELFTNGLWTRQLQFTSPRTRGMMNLPTLGMIAGKYRPIEFPEAGASTAGLGVTNKAVEQLRGSTEWRSSHEDGMYLVNQAMVKDFEWATRLVLARVGAPFYFHRQHWLNQTDLIAAIGKPLNLVEATVVYEFRHINIGIANAADAPSPAAIALVTDDQLRKLAARLWVWTYVGYRVTEVFNALELYRAPFAELPRSHPVIKTMLEEVAKREATVRDAVNDLLVLVKRGMANPAIAVAGPVEFTATPAQIFREIDRRAARQPVLVAFVSTEIGLLLTGVARNVVSFQTRIAELGATVQKACNGLARSLAEFHKRDKLPSRDYPVGDVPISRDRTVDVLRIELSRRLRFGRMLAGRLLRDPAHQPSATEPREPWDWIVELSKVVDGQIAADESNKPMRLSFWFESISIVCLIVQAVWQYSQRGNIIDGGERLSDHHRSLRPEMRSALT